MMSVMQQMFDREDGWLAPQQWCPPVLNWESPNEQGRQWCTRNDRFIALRLSMAAHELTGVFFPYQVIDVMVDYCREPVTDFSQHKLIFKYEKAHQTNIHIYFPLFFEVQLAGRLIKTVKWRNAYINRKEFFDQLAPTFKGDYWQNCIFAWRAANNKQLKQVIYFPGRIWSDGQSEQSYVVMEDKKLHLRFPILEPMIFFFDKVPTIRGRPI